MTSLLDVNVLISLLDANHTHHAAAKGWFGQISDPWASCPLTQNGYLRIVTGTKYQNRLSMNGAFMKLSQAIATPNHEFMPDDISLLNPQNVTRRHIQGPKQLTDIYLLALSVKHGARLVTIDTKVPLVAVPQATNTSLYVIQP